MSVPLTTELKNWVYTSYFLHRSIFCLSIYMSVSKPSRHQYVFENGLFQPDGRTSCLLQTSIWEVIERVHVVYGSYFSWRHKTLLFWHWSSQVFPKGCFQHDLKMFCQTGSAKKSWKLVESIGSFDHLPIFIKTNSKMCYQHFIPRSARC